MEPSRLRRAIAAAVSTASELGFATNNAVVLHDSNRVSLRLVPCDIVASVGGPAHAEVALLEVDIALRLAEIGAPVASLADRVGPRVFERDEFSITLWTYYEPVGAGVEPPAYAGALEHLHAGLRALDVRTPHFTARVAEAQQLVASPDQTPALVDADRELLEKTLRSVTKAVARRRTPEQLLHGEPHPGNLLNTMRGPIFIDFETVCRGPIEFDLAHVPDAVSDVYPGIDEDLLNDCRRLVVAMIAAWRSDRTDDLPNGPRARHQLMEALRQGPPYPSLDRMMGDS